MGSGGSMSGATVVATPVLGVCTRHCFHALDEGVEGYGGADPGEGDGSTVVHLYQLPPGGPDSSHLSSWKQLAASVKLLVLSSSNGVRFGRAVPVSNVP